MHSAYDGLPSGRLKYERSCCRPAWLKMCNEGVGGVLGACCMIRLNLGRSGCRADKGHEKVGKPVRTPLLCS